MSRTTFPIVTLQLLDALNNRLQQQSMTHKSEIMVYKEQLDQEAAGVTALQQQIKENEQLLKNYKQTIKEVTYFVFLHNYTAYF